MASGSTAPAVQPVNGAADAANKGPTARRPNGEQQHDALDGDGSNFQPGPSAMPDEPDADDIADLESNIIHQSRTIEDFTRIIAEWRSEREKGQTTNGAASIRTSMYGAGAQAGEGSSSPGHLRVRSSIASLSDAASQYSYEASSLGDPDEARLSPSFSPHGEDGAQTAVRVRCTCCCGRGTRRCKRARRATREWSQMESDLNLAAQIGQALLRRSDALHAELTQAQEEHGGRINSIMKKLSSSIKEAGQLEKRLEQSELNMEACEASNRALVRELDETRREAAKSRGTTARTAGLEMRLERAEGEVEDLRQEMVQEQKRTEQAKGRIKRVEKVNADLQSDLRLAKVQGQRVEVTDEERAHRKEEMRRVIDRRMEGQGVVLTGGMTGATEDTQWMEKVMTENDALLQENKQMKALLDTRNEEVVLLREELSQKSEFALSTEGSVTKSDQAGGALRIADLHPTTPLTALSDELVDVHPSVFEARQAHARSASSFTTLSQDQCTPGFLSPQSAISPLPSMPSSTSTTTVATTIETGGDATSHSDAAKSSRSTTGSVGASQAGASTPTLSAVPSSKRETRTAQLIALIDMISRLFSRLSTADVDTMAKRLQRQKLTGDVGHLARTTVNGILRDVDGLRDHFRRSMDSESRNRETDSVSLHSRNSSKSASGAPTAESESLVARKELFALIKVFKDLFLEMARLRNAVNEVSLQPQHASRILQEQLGVQVSEDKGMGAWFGRLLSTTGLPGAVSPSAGTTSSATASGPSGSAAAGLSALGLGQSVGAGAGSGGPAKPGAARTASGTQLNPSRAEAVSSSVAIEVKGMHAAEQTSPALLADGSSRGASPQPDQATFDATPPSHARPEPGRRQPSLGRVQSRNLSGLFAGSMVSDAAVITGASGTSPGTTGGFLPTRNRMASDMASSSMQGSRLSRIVDDDEISIHHGITPRARTLRPRNLSDSSMHTTYLDDAPAIDDDGGGGKETSPRRARAPGLMAAAAPTPAAISRVITPSTLSLQASRDGQASSRRTSSSTAGGLLGALAPSTRSVAKAFSLLSPSAGTAAPTATTNTTLATSPTNLSPPPVKPRGEDGPPTLRKQSSHAQIALAAATATATGGKEEGQRR